MNYEDLREQHARILRVVDQKNQTPTRRKLIDVLTSRRAMHIATAVVVALGLLILGAHLDSNAEQATADTAADARHQARRVALIEQAAKQLCADDTGPGSAAAWTADGELMCRPLSLPIASN